MGMSSKARFHILAVDDSLIDRRLIERLLKTVSCQVTTVDSGIKALEFLGLRENQTDASSVSNGAHHEIGVNLIITDYCMPGMTGYDLLKKIKESTALKHVPVVIMSSENVPSRIRRCLEEGAEEFFLKPVRLSDMNRLRSHLAESKIKDELLHPQENGESQLLHQQPTNKRKTIDENLSPEKRPRYSGVPVV